LIARSETFYVVANIPTSRRRAIRRKEPIRKEFNMDIKVVQAYANGRIAGSKHSLAKQLEPTAQRPNNPHPGTDYLASIEWERGFTEGLAAAGRFSGRPASSNKAGTKQQRA
jgi:hypothetical protein